MHIFLTGHVQVGKSTVISKVLKTGNFNVQGFKTLKDRSGNGDLYIFRASEEFDNNKKQDNLVAVSEGNRMTAFTDVFDKLGPKFLHIEKSADFDKPVIVLMDELGRLERNAGEFKKAVFDVLDKDHTVLGVIREGFPGWSIEVANRPDVKMITVTEENRNDLPEIILKLLNADKKEQ